jgi:antirestriction protein ArdC
VNFYVVLEKASVKQSKTERFKDAEQYVANSRMSLGHSTMGMDRIGEQMVKTAQAQVSVRSWLFS